MYTIQQYYDLLVCSALDGMFPAYDPVRRICRYRTDAGRACGVGIVIPDKDYVLEMEGRAPTLWPVDLQLRLTRAVPGVSVKAFTDIQAAHDRYDKNWAPELFIEDINGLDLFAKCKKVAGPYSTKAA